MSNERWERVRTLLQQALERRPADREAFLTEVCGDDSTLRVEIESLLDSHERGGSLLGDPPASASAAAVQREDRQELEGRRIGAYRVQRLIGRGGAGSVYLAVRDDAQYEKRVAVKVLRRGMATADMLSRFRSERQILASIDHPNIARLLDGGTTEEGLPYFVMEYIEGEPLDRYCDARRLTITERLRLFETVCDAVQVAHQSLVVHRDLKPGNILVTASGVPKLLDFGIAKLLDPDLVSDVPDPTFLDLRVMTPEFASPEQIQGRAITTASDVYSLGVLLYELLTGHRPLRLSHLPVHEMEVVASSEEPRRPSEIVGTESALRLGDGTVREITPESVGTARGTSPQRLSKQLVGDLDNILLRALRKEPQRRYASAEQLREDLRRFREGLPVLARPDTFAYRSGKFLRRHRLPVAVAGTALLLAAGFTSALVVQAGRVADERDRAAREAAKVRVVNHFLQEILGSADPMEGLGRDVTVVEALEAAAPRIDQAFSAQPEIEAAVRQTVGQTFARLGRFDEAEKQLRQALAIRRRVLGNHDVAVAETLNALGELRYDRADLDGAERFYREALSLRRELLGPEHADIAASIDNLGNVFHDRGELDQAEALYREGLTMRRHVLGPEHQDVASSLNNLAVLMHDRGDLDEAERLYRQSLALTRQALGDEHPDVAIGLNNLAALLHDRGDLEEAERLYRESVAMTRKLLGPGHPGLIVNLHNLATLLEDRGQYDEAEDLYQETLGLARDAYGEEHPDVVAEIDNLATLYREQGRWADAEPLFAQALEIGRRHYGDDAPLVLEMVIDHALCLAHLGSAAEAEPQMREAYATVEDLVGRFLEGADEASTPDSADAAPAFENPEEARALRGAMAERMAELYELLGRGQIASRYRAAAEADLGRR